MQIEIGITLNASPALLEVLGNLAAGLSAETAINRASRKPATPKALVGAKVPPAAQEAAPVDEAKPAEVRKEQPGKPLATGAATTSPSEPVTITVAQVRAAFATLAGRDRDAAIAILARHGVKSVSALDPAAYAEVMVEVEAV